MFIVEMNLLSVEMYSDNAEMNTNDAETCALNVEIEPNDAATHSRDAEEKIFDAEPYPNNVEPRSIDAAMQTSDVEIFTESPTYLAYISTPNGHISTSIRDGVEMCACIAASKSFGVANYGNSSTPDRSDVEEWAIGVEDDSMDVAKISSSVAPCSLNVGPCGEGLDG